MNESSSVRRGTRGSAHATGSIHAKYHGNSVGENSIMSRNDHPHAAARNETDPSLGVTHDLAHDREQACRERSEHAETGEHDAR